MLIRYFDKFFIILTLFYSLLPLLRKEGFLYSEFSINFLIDHILKPAVVVFFMITAKPPKEINLSRLAFFAIFTSYLAPLLFETLPAVQTSNLILVFGLASSLFYIILLFASYFTLGKNLGVIPALRKLITTGPYQFIRHPIYSSYLHIFSIYVIFNLSLKNIIILILLAFSLFIRAKEEDNVLKNSIDFYSFSTSVPNRLFNFWFSFPLVLLFFISLINTVKIEKNPPVRLQFAYPILSLNPLIYDDWTSVFIGNHIFPRLLKNNEKPWFPSITDNLDITCTDPNLNLKNLPCNQVKIEFKVKAFKDCMGREMNTSDIQYEITKILETKNWILPSWKLCHPISEDHICLTAKNTKDILRRMQNLYFRFGWSKISSSDSVFGIQPYCLHVEKKEGNSTITNGLLNANSDDLPDIEFHTSLDKNSDFDIALYGDEVLIKNKRRNVQAHTPLAYYLITHQKWANYRIPWNTEEVQNYLEKAFQKFELTYSGDVSQISQILPHGKALENTALNKKIFPIKKHSEILIPDYLSECDNIVEGLNNILKKKHPRVYAKCANTVNFIDQKIRLKNGTWDAFITPISPGAPGKDALKFQYFSPVSNDSFTQNFNNPEALFYLIGIGKSAVTVDGEKFCGLLPNSLGLGEILITDFKTCRK